MKFASLPNVASALSGLDLASKRPLPVPSGVGLSSREKKVGRVGRVSDI